MKILVGTPTYNGQLTTQYTRSLLELWTEIGAKADWRPTKATLIAWARNVFASHVLEEDYTHLLFVDADTRWAPGALRALLVEARRTRAEPLRAGRRLFTADIRLASAATDRLIAQATATYAMSDG